jgi:hypothetical protein
MANADRRPDLPNSGRCPSAYSCIAWHIRSNSVAAMIVHSTASFRYQDEPNADLARLRVGPARMAAHIQMGQFCAQRADVPHHGYEHAKSGIGKNVVEAW